MKKFGRLELGAGETPAPDCSALRGLPAIHAVSVGIK